MIRLILLVRSLGIGGAERQLIELAKGLDKTRFDVTVVTFYDGGALRPEIEGIEGVRVISLHKAGRWDVAPFLWRLMRTVRTLRPQIIHGYLDGPNAVGLLMARLVGACSVWGLRASNIEFAHYDWFAGWLFRAGAWLSRWADLIIVNSQAGKQHHVACGYRGTRMMVIHNGIDTERFHPDRAAGRQQRDAWGVAPEEQLIGIVGRLAPMKGHPAFLRAAVRLRQLRTDVRFVCVGDGPAEYRERVQALAGELGIGPRIIWAGPSQAMVAVYNALDVIVSASLHGEGFSNVIGEALACAVPAVVTDVGDSALIVGNADRVVPPDDPEALAQAVVRILSLPREQRDALGSTGRERIIQEFDRHSLVHKTEAALASLVPERS